MMELNIPRHFNLICTFTIILSFLIQSSLSAKMAIDKNGPITNIAFKPNLSPVLSSPTPLFPIKSKSKWKKPDLIKVNTTKFSEESRNAPTSNLTGKIGQPKQSWLAVASAVAHSAAAASDNTPQQIPGNEDSKPTKYHYYPHNQHLYLLPECATQQVCSAVYLRLNYSQPLCACPTTHQPCSVSTRTDDRHTIPLVTGSQSQILTLVKTCERTQEVRECRAPKDWSILALQNSRTGKAHYLVICRCPTPGYLEGPIAHSQPAYARVPGIRVYGMTCVRTDPNRGGRTARFTQENSETSQNPPFPWQKLTFLLDRAAKENLR